MILPYLVRLLCLCFASFFVLNVVAGLFVRILSKSAIRFAESRTPHRAARLLLGLRLLPFALAAVFVLGLCVPSYLWLEPPASSERVGLVGGVLGLLGATTWLISLARTAHSLFRSLLHNRLCRLAGQEARLPGESSPVVLVENEAPLLAMSGLVRPRLLISRSVLQNLSAEELDAALSHEHAHRTSRDNLKRLLLQLAPDIFPFLHPLRTLECTWSQFAEWAADDQATAGDSRRAVSLAAALVQVARMGRGPRLPFLSTSLLACDRDLSARVDRLLETLPVIPSPALKAQPVLRAAVILVVGCLAALLATPATLSVVHELLELLLH
jgi:beta-lactamase regulating signal transducer with metallopeptidase domain